MFWLLRCKEKFWFAEGGDDNEDVVLRSEFLKDANKSLLKDYCIGFRKEKYYIIVTLRMLMLP